MHKEKRQKLSTILKNNLFVLGKVAKFTPDYFVWMVAEGLVWGMINSASAIFSYNLLNAVGNGTDFSYALRIVVIMAVFKLLTFAFDKWYWIIKNPLVRRKLQLKMHSELFAKAQALDLSCFDDPEFYNDFVWAMNESDKQAIQVIENTGKLINRIVASTSLFGLMLTVDPIIALILFVSSVITVISNLIGNKIGFEHNKETNPLWRKKDYINRVYRLSDYSKELRISRVDELLMNEFDDNNEKIIDLEVKYGKKYYVFYGLGWDAVSVITFFAILLYMVNQLGNGALAVGGFAATVNVVWSIRWMFANLIERITNYSKYSLYIEKYREFLSFKPDIKGAIKEVPEFECLEFNNVSFSYEFASHPRYKFRNDDCKLLEENDKYVLKNVSFKLKKGEKIAIVGYNGAGKTTLIKLMMRFYDPTEGEILYNGINIKEYDPAFYRKMIGAVFQDYKLFATSVAANVMNGKYNETTDRNTVTEALKKADFTEKLQTLKDGVNTHLTREFNEEGVNLSGGEMQKLAIARVFAEDYPIIIMDEPSSALDPAAEYNLNQSILKATDDKTVVFISHRLSTTRIADRIYMFSKGSLVEEGTHNELLSINGKYAEMFRVQSKKYENCIPES